MMMIIVTNDNDNDNGNDNDDYYQVNGESLTTLTCLT